MGRLEAIARLERLSDWIDAAGEKVARGEPVPEEPTEDAGDAWETEGPVDDSFDFEPEQEAPRSEAAKHTGPTADDPLRGLDALVKVATFGLEKLQALAAQPVTWAWRDVVVAATICLLASLPGEGKTTLLFLILVARLNLGAPITLLGRVVEPAPLGMFVVLIEGEHSDPSTARKLLRTCAALGVEPACLARIIVIARKAVRIGSPEWLDIKRLIATGLVSDVAIDTIARLGQSDPNDEASQVAFYDEVAQAIDGAPREEVKPTAWLLGHSRKSGNGGLEDVSGSVQRTGQADSVLMLRAERLDGRVVSTKVTFAKLREEPEEYPPAVEFKVTKSSVVTTNAPTEVDDRPLEDRVFERLQLAPRTKNKLREELGRSDKDIEDAISNLFASRQITTTTVKVRGIDRKGFAPRNLTGLSPDSGGSPDLTGPHRTSSREGVNHAE
jgi:hypothetical protein